MSKENDWIKRKNVKKVQHTERIRLDFSKEKIEDVARNVISQYLNALSPEEIEKRERAFNAMLHYEFEQKKYEDAKVERRDFPMRERFVNRRPDMSDIAASYKTTIKEMKAQRNAVEKRLESK